MDDQHPNIQQIGKYYCTISMCVKTSEEGDGDITVMKGESLVLSHCTTLSRQKQPKNSLPGESTSEVTHHEISAP